MGASRPSIHQIQGWHDRLSGLYSNRNSEYDIMRRAFDGNFVSNQQAAANPSSELVDKRQLHYNLINTSTRRFMDEMSAPVTAISVPRGIETRDLKVAENRQKLLARIWTQQKMPLKIVMGAYYQSLLDDCIWHVRPAPDQPFKVAIELMVPEAVFPVPWSSKWGEPKEWIVSWRKFDIDKSQSLDPDGRNPQSPLSADMRVIEYHSDDWIIRVEDGVETFARHHGWGFAPFTRGYNIPIPHRWRGQGDGDQVLGLNEYLNRLISDQADVLAYLANPIVVVRGSRMGVNQLVFGPRVIWDLERDGSAEILTWAGSPPSFETQILRVMQGIEDSTGISSPAFGREIPSGVSGETVRSILAGFNTRVGAKQQLMGLAIADMLWKLQCILEKEFPNEEFEVPGEDRSNRGDRGVMVQPKDWEGWYDVMVVFQPQNETVRVFTELEKMKNGVQSKLTTMRRLGIVNAEDERERIIEEKRMDAVFDMAKNGTFAAQGQDLSQFLPQDQRPRRLPSPGVQPLREIDFEEMKNRLAGGDPGQLSELLGAEGAAAGQRAGSMRVELRDAMELLEDVDVSGRVMLEGDILEQGFTTGPLRLRVEREEDIPQVREALGALGSRAQFSVHGRTPETGEHRLPVGRRRR